MKRYSPAQIVAILALCLLSACGDKGWYTPTTEVDITRKGCVIADSLRHDIFLNITSERLPNGEMRCVIETVKQPEKE